MSDLRAEISRDPYAWNRKRWEVHLYDSETPEPGKPLGKRRVGVGYRPFATYAEAVEWADSQVCPLRTWQHKSRGVITGRLVGRDGGWMRIKLWGSHPDLRIFEEELMSCGDGEVVDLLASNLMEIQTVPARAAS